MSAVLTILYAIPNLDLFQVNMKGLDGIQRPIYVAKRYVSTDKCFMEFLPYFAFNAKETLMTMVWYVW